MGSFRAGDTGAVQKPSLVRHLLQERDRSCHTETPPTIQRRPGDAPGGPGPGPGQGPFVSLGFNCLHWVSKFVFSLDSSLTAYEEGLITMPS